MQRILYRLSKWKMSNGWRFRGWQLPFRYRKWLLHSIIFLQIQTRKWVRKMTDLNVQNGKYSHSTSVFLGSKNDAGFYQNIWNFPKTRTVLIVSLLRWPWSWNDWMIDVHSQRNMVGINRLSLSSCARQTGTVNLIIGTKKWTIS
jgi:hypothetical protein